MRVIRQVTVFLVVLQAVNQARGLPLNPTTEETFTTEETKETFTTEDVAEETVSSAYQTGSPFLCEGDKVTEDEPDPFCVDDLGCLEENLCRILSIAPLERDLINTTFRIYTRFTPEGEVVVGKNVSQVLETSFSAERDTKIIIHGFISSSEEKWVLDMVKVFLAHFDVNVVTVDWRNGSEGDISQAISNLRVVALEVANFVNWLTEEIDLNASDVHMIGHSLGAHGAGYAGGLIPDLGRITGLDPAGMLFTEMPPSMRLDPTDAQFVDVIHTDNLIGISIPIGHIDFYPNGGELQPGCEMTLANLLKKTTLEEAEQIDIFCSHKRAPKLFTDSIESDCPYLAFMCDSYQDYMKGYCKSCGEHGSECASLGLFPEKYLGAADWQYNKHNKTQRKFYLSTGSLPHPCQYHSVVTIDSKTPLKKEQNFNLSVDVFSNEGNITFDISSSKLLYHQDSMWKPKESFDMTSQEFQRERTLGSECEIEISRPNSHE